MALPIILTYAADNTTLIAPVQTLAAAGFLQLNGDYAGINRKPQDPLYPYAGATIPNMGRTLSISSIQDNSGLTFRIRGEDVYNQYITETITGPGAVAIVYTAKKYHKIYNIYASDATVGTGVSVGTGNGADFGWRAVNTQSANSRFSIQGIADGTISYSVIQSASPMQTANQLSPTNVQGFPLSPAITNETGDVYVSQLTPASGFNLVVDKASTASDAKLTLTILQQGIV